MNEKYYRLPWTEEKESTLIKYWPHWGSEELSKLLDLSIVQVKSKVNKLKLKTLPKTERLCVECKTEYQFHRTYGLRCSTCARRHRKTIRGKSIKTRDVWMGDLLRTLKHRSIEPCDLDLEYLLDLWEKQGGKCYYSNLELSEPNSYGAGRNYLRASMDRKDSEKGYVQGNVVWSSWACNAGKMDFKMEDYLQICQAVSKHLPGRLSTTLKTLQ